MKCVVSVLAALLCVGSVGGSSGVGSDWTVPLASFQRFPVVFLSVADQHPSVRMCDHLIPLTVTERQHQNNKVCALYFGFKWSLLIIEMESINYV